MLSKIDEVYKRLVRIYAYKFPEPLHMLSFDIMKIQNQGKSRERAVLELSLQLGVKPREYLALLHEDGRSEEDAIQEFLKGEVLSVSDGDEDIRTIIAEATRSKAIDPYDRTQYGARRPEPTKAWYLVPLIFSILGGLIGYVAVKDDDRDLANNLLVVGILIFFLNLIGLWILF